MALSWGQFYSGVGSKAYIPLQRKTACIGGSCWAWPQREYFALPIPTCWYLKSLADPKRSPPDQTPSSTDPTRVPTDPTRARREQVEYNSCGVPSHWGSRWACTFHVVCVNLIQVGYPTPTQFPAEYGL